jgi:hypothetical protein
MSSTRIFATLATVATVGGGLMAASPVQAKGHKPHWSPQKCFQAVQSYNQSHRSATPKQRQAFIEKLNHKHGCHITVSTT